MQNIDRIPKLAALSHMLDYEQIIVEIANRNISNAGYPEWTVPKNLFELIYKTPIRLIYFLFSPFPWDINKLSHFMGLFDGLFFIILTLILLKILNLYGVKFTQNYLNNFSELFNYLWNIDLKFWHWNKT